MTHLFVRHRKWQPELESLRQCNSLLSDAQPRVQGDFYRLPNHNRMITVTRYPSALLLQSAPYLCSWVQNHYSVTSRQCSIGWFRRHLGDPHGSWQTIFPSLRGKIQAVLFRREAASEAECALMVQRAHLEHYGELAKLPVPLLVHCVRDAQRSSCASVLEQKLEARVQ